MSRPSSRLNFWSVAAELDVGPDRDRVVALQQRVQQLQHRDRLAGGVALGEVVALEHLGDGRGAHQREQLRHRHVEPLAVEAHLEALGARAPSAPAPGTSRALASICAGSSTGRERRAPARIADPRRVVADDQHDRVPEILELAQLLQHDREAEVDVGRGRVDPELDAQRPAERQLALRARPRAGNRRRCGSATRPHRRRRRMTLDGHPGQC